MPTVKIERTKTIVETVFVTDVADKTEALAKIFADSYRNGKFWHETNTTEVEVTEVTDQHMAEQEAEFNSCMPVECNTISTR